MLAPTSFTWIATCALRAFTDSVAIGPPKRRNIYACAYVMTLLLLDHICQAIYNLWHVPEGKTVPARSSLSRPGRSHAASSPQPDCRQRDLRLLLCSDPRDEPAENLASFGVSPPRGHRRRAASA